MNVKQSYPENGSCVLMHMHFSILPCFVLRGMCGKWSEYGKDDKLPCDRYICIFLRLRRVRTVHLGFINTENKGHILYIVAHPFQQHFSQNKSEYD